MSLPAVETDREETRALEVLDQIKANFGMFDMPLFEISGTTVTVATLITFAFPQLDLHFDPQVVESLATGPRRLKERRIEPESV